MDPSYIDGLIAIHTDSIASSKRRARLLVTGGGTMLLVAAFIWVLALQRKIDSNLVPSLVSIVGIFFSSCSLLPYKEITPGRIKLLRFSQLRRECERIKDLPDQERTRRIREINEGLEALE
jgi:hypothetical protein